MDTVQEISNCVGAIPLSVSEIIALALLLYGAIMGLKHGFLKELASMTGFFIGLLLAWHYYDRLGGGAVTFLAIWIVTPIALGLCASMVTKVLDWTIVGGLLNRLLGCLLGTAKWAVLIVCVMAVTGQCDTIRKYIDPESVPKIDYIKKQWETLQKKL